MFVAGQSLHTRYRSNAWIYKKSLRIEVAQVLEIEFLGLRVRVCHHYELSKSGSVGIVVKPRLFDLGPVAIHQHLGRRMAHETQIAIGIVIVDRELPGL